MKKNNIELETLLCIHHALEKTMTELKLHQKTFPNQNGKQRLKALMEQKRECLKKIKKLSKTEKSNKNLLKFIFTMLLISTLLKSDQYNNESKEKKQTINTTDENQDYSMKYETESVTVFNKCTNYSAKRVVEYHMIEYTEPILSHGILTKELGKVLGPNGPETYYDLDMDLVIENMQKMGYEGEFWIREDGTKMFGDYVIVAADLNKYPKGTILETSLGTAMVCDTGEFVNESPEVIDIAANWTRNLEK